MARVRNSTFQGASIYDVDIDQLTFRRVIANAVGDTALVEDILTGDNTPPTDSVVNHAGLDGALYRGCPLGAPLVNLLWPGAPYASGPTVEHGEGADVWLFAMPIFLPRGETTLDVTMTVSAVFPQAIVRVLDFEDMSEVASAAFGSRSPLAQVFARVTGLEGGTRYIFVVHALQGVLQGPAADAEVTRVLALTVGWNRINGAAPLAEPPYNPSGDVRLPTVTTAGATYMATTDFEPSLLADGRAISSYHLTRLAANQNAIEEHMTGAPAAGNTAITLVPTTTVDPFRSAFHDHSASNEKNHELGVDFPIWAEAFGGVQPDGLDAEMVSAWQPPKLLNYLDSNVDLVEVPLYIPDGVLGAFHVMVLAASLDNTWIGALLVECFDAGGTSAGSAVAADFDEHSYAGHFVVAVAEGIAYHRDTLNMLRLRFDSATGSSGQEVAILGAFAYFEGG